MAGSVTLIGTRSNVVIAGIAGERGVDMTMLSFAAVALPVALAGAVVVHGDHEPRDQRRHGVDRHPGRASPRGRRERRPHDHPRSGRHLRLVHVHQPVRHPSNVMVMQPGGYTGGVLRALLPHGPGSPTHM